MQTSAMNFGHFSPHGQPRPCWHCKSFGAMIYGGTAALCWRPGAVPVQAQPREGCAFWEREPGADDEQAAPVPICGTTVAKLLARGSHRNELSQAIR